MGGKTVAVTGASRGLGYVAAVALAQKGATVFMLNRASPRAEASLREVAAAASGEAPSLVECDLLDFASVSRAASRLREGLGGRGLDVLCLNAGIMLQPDAASADGYDVTAATNVLSHFLLARELLPDLVAAARGGAGDARVVSMSSGSGFGEPAFDARFLSRAGGRLGGARASYERYHQSKLANLLFTAALHDRLAAGGSRLDGVKALACTPGVCGTDMFVHVSGSDDLSRVPSVEDGALAMLKCACDPTLRSGQCFGPTGGLGGPPGEFDNAPPRVLVDASAKDALWAACEAAVGPFPVP